MVENRAIILERIAAMTDALVDGSAGGNEAHEAAVLPRRLKRVLDVR